VTVLAQVLRRSSLRWLSTIGLLLVASFATVLSFTGYLGELHWYLDLTSHFKRQYLLVGVVTLVCGWWGDRRWRKALIGVSLLCVVLNLVEIVPWYLPQKATTLPSAVPLRLLHSNVLVRNRQYASVISLVRETKPDIAVFQEVNAGWLTALEVIRDQLPYTYAEPDAVGFGNVIYSVLPLEQPSVQFLGQTKVSSLVAQVRKGAQSVTLITTHPPPPIRAALFQSRNQLLTAIAPYVRSQTSPVILLGDFNISLWSPYYKRLEADSGLRNSRAGFGLLPSWSPRAWLSLLAIPIDHCLVSPGITVLKTQTGRNVGSDHLPLIVDVAVPRG
jgi:endonuclease/exonuclease/phosphatase (EEP) superfamily protein YafD